MFAALNIGAVALGVVAGGLIASVLGLVVGGGLSLAGAEWGADVGLVVGVITGLAAGGWVAGRRCLHSPRFHGAVTGIVLAFVVMVIARLGGSTAGTAVILWLALLSIVVAGFSGWVAGRPRAG